MNRELLLDIAHTYGTPAYVYDLDQVAAEYRRLSNAFAGMPADIHYAVKANFNPHVLRTLRDSGAGADCVSIPEVEHALAAGFAPEAILYTPSCPSTDDLKKAVRYGVRLHLGALEYVEWMGRHFPRYPVGLRLNPGLETGGNQKIATAHSRSKFGIPWAYKDRLFDLLRQYGLQIRGLHVHMGSDVQSWRDLTAGVDFLTSVAPLFADLEYLDFGSGLKVPYRPGERSFDIEAYARYIREKTAGLPGVRIKLEPGKFLVARAGVFLMQVNIVKETPLQTFAGVNTGFNHMLRPMYYDAYHHIENLSNPGGTPRIYDVVGHLCEEDTFARNRQIAEIRPGDILALHNAGAYGYVMASHYNLHPLPREITVQGQKIVET
jgi:diaminopimelate decarboxylase